jgi:RNA polymerase sigma-70 factor (ECF subfamily)
MTTTGLGNEEAPPESNGPVAGSAALVTTHWSVVLAADQADTTRARNALSRLCQTYWLPLYAYVRRSGYSQHDAQDLTQEFFARLPGKNVFAEADESRGRFRPTCLRP